MKLGKIDINVVSGGRFWLDGGAMFGLIPKPIWQHLHQPDEHNRILMETNCPLVQTSDGKWVLVDTGNGTKFGPKEKERFNIEPGSPLLDNLKKHHLTPDDIDIVILSHLHFDHAGGGTTYINGQLKPTFPKAKYFIQKAEWEDALANRSVMTKTYLKENFACLSDHEVLELVDGTQNIHKEVQLLATGGHTRGHQAVVFQSDGKKAIYFGDLIPMASHIPYPYVMSYDTFPLYTLDKKKELLPQAMAEQWLIIWDHDPGYPMGYLRKTDEARFIFKGLEHPHPNHCIE